MSAEKEYFKLVKSLLDDAVSIGFDQPLTGRNPTKEMHEEYISYNNRTLKLIYFKESSKIALDSCYGTFTPTGGMEGKKAGYPIMSEIYLLHDEEDSAFWELEGAKATFSTEELTELWRLA